MRPFLFVVDAEKMHDLTLSWLKNIECSPLKVFLNQKCVSDPVEVFGIQFPNRIGLAAGLDKNGDCIDALAALGFGHIEIGTVTPRPQPGNPKPRLFRLTKIKGLINRFGFNNQGVDYLIENVKKAKFDGVLGINIGKNFDTPLNKATDDYISCLKKVYPYASYITVNISSPNTENLRQLQFGEALEELLKELNKQQVILAKQHAKKTPILVKIAPDLDDSEIKLLVKTFKKYQVDGVIATNTTFSRIGCEKLEHADEQGGLSGAPLFDPSTEVLRKFCKEVNGAFPVIGVGGIDSGEKAQQKIDAGASLVQIYSGFVYEGPALITEIAEFIKRKVTSK